MVPFSIVDGQFARRARAVASLKANPATTIDPTPENIIVSCKSLGGNLFGASNCGCLPKRVISGSSR
jgi:hypothetical protein